MEKKKRYLFCFTTAGRHALTSGVSLSVSRQPCWLPPSFPCPCDSLHSLAAVNLLVGNSQQAFDFCCIKDRAPAHFFFLFLIPSFSLSFALTPHSFLQAPKNKYPFSLSLSPATKTNNLSTSLFYEQPSPSPTPTNTPANNNHGQVHYPPCRHRCDLCCLCLGPGQHPSRRV